MYKSIDVNKVLQKLYTRDQREDDLLSTFTKVANLIKLKAPDSYKNMKVYSTSGYRCYAIQTRFAQFSYNAMFNNKNTIEGYIKHNKINIDEDRYLVCIPDTFANFVLCEKYKNIETYYTKLFLHENKLDADHILGDYEKTYIFLHTLKQCGITGTVHLYNVDKCWSVPVLSNVDERIYGLGKSVYTSNTKDNVECIDMRSTKILERRDILNAQSKNEFGTMDVLHLSHALKNINVISFLRGIHDKNVFMGDPSRNSDKTLENIKSAILGAMYDK